MANNMQNKLRGRLSAFVIGALCPMVVVDIACTAENITINEFYPSPIGSYKEIRAKRMAIGANYADRATLPWSADASCGGSEICNAEVAIEGNVGIGTRQPGIVAGYPYAGFKFLHLASSGEPSFIIQSASDSATLNPLIFSQRSRGTNDLPTAVQNDDTLYEVYTMGYSGTQHAEVGHEWLNADGNALASEVPAKFIWFVAPQGTWAAQPRMTLRASGRLGVGDMNPVSLLHVSYSNSELNPNDGILVSNYNGVNGSLSGIRFSVGSSEAAGEYAKQFIGSVRRGTNGFGDIVFLIRDAVDTSEVTISDEKMRITAEGRVGIGTSAPVGQLHVNSPDVYKTDGVATWTDSSDIRLKKDIAPLERPLEMMLKLKGVAFEYTERESARLLPGTQIGFVAQDVEKVFPEWVGRNPDGYRNLKISGFEALSVEALRELVAENDRLRALVTEFEAQVHELERLAKK
jgi:hypothetical protein